MEGLTIASQVPQIQTGVGHVVVFANHFDCAASTWTQLGRGDEKRPVGSTETEADAVAVDLGHENG